MNDDALKMLLQLGRTQAQVARDLERSLGNGIGYSDFTLMRALAESPTGRLRPVDLADQLHLTASGVTRALLPLEKIGMVAREREERDGRVSYARLTPAGAVIVAESGESAAYAATKIASKLSLGQTRQLSRLLEELVSLGRR
ncbi:MAG TPA: MarR family transcriptional regulator [Candidatus Baltobacteraceae bacterium]